MREVLKEYFGFILVASLLFLGAFGMYSFFHVDEYSEYNETFTEEFKKHKYYFDVNDSSLLTDLFSINEDIESFEYQLNFIELIKETDRKYFIKRIYINPKTKNTIEEREEVTYHFIPPSEHRIIFKYDIDTQKAKFFKREDAKYRLKDLLKFFPENEFIKEERYNEKYIYSNLNRYNKEGNIYLEISKNHLKKELAETYQINLKNKK